MAEDLYGLDESQVTRLGALLDAFEGGRLDALLAPDPVRFGQRVEVRLARLGSSGMAPRVDSAAGSGVVSLYQSDDTGGLLDSGDTITAYNLFSAGLAGSSYGVLARDPFSGQYFFLPAGSSTDLTVERSDGSEAVLDVNTLQFAPVPSWTIDNPGLTPGLARVTPRFSGARLLMTAGTLSLPPGTSANIPFDNLPYDTDSYVSSAAGACPWHGFTLPFAGAYLIELNVVWLLTDDLGAATYPAGSDIVLGYTAASLTGSAMAAAQPQQVCPFFKWGTSGGAFLGAPYPAFGVGTVLGTLNIGTVVQGTAGGQVIALAGQWNNLTIGGGAVSLTLEGGVNTASLSITYLGNPTGYLSNGCAGGSGSGSGSGSGGGGGTVITSCCPAGLPPVLHATITGGCMAGSYAITWDGSSWDFNTAADPCTGTEFFEINLLCDSGGTFELFVHCGGDSLHWSAPASLDCAARSIVFGSKTATFSSCGGSITISVTITD